MSETVYPPLQEGDRDGVIREVKQRLRENTLNHEHIERLAYLYGSATKAWAMMERLTMQHEQAMHQDAEQLVTKANPA